MQLGFMRRFDSAYLKAKERIDKNEVGKPISLLGISRDPSCPPIKFAASSGGMILDLCVHDLDLCRWYAGSEAVEIYARGGVVRYEELAEVNDIDHVNIDVRFANGFSLLGKAAQLAVCYDVRTEIVCSEWACRWVAPGCSFSAVGAKGITVIRSQVSLSGLAKPICTIGVFLFRTSLQAEAFVGCRWCGSP